MGDAPAGFETMAFDDFEEFFAHTPCSARWQSIGGRVASFG
ncbi:hypothetical protein [Methylobacterium sp. BTF04]|nr:hypothetical protein [Methylobacterium sp. BTF04]